MLWLFFRNESLRAVSNRFLASLSVVDFLVGIVIDPIWITFGCLIQPSNVTQAALNEFMEMLWIHATAATTLNLCCVCVCVSADERPSSFPSRIIQNYKAIKTIGFVLGVFVVSWMPCLVLSIVHEFSASDPCTDEKLYDAAWPWIEAVALSSSAINPWVYFFHNGEFRQALHRSIRRVTRKS